MAFLSCNCSCLTLRVSRSVRHRGNGETNEWCSPTYWSSTVDKCILLLKPLELTQCDRDIKWLKWGTPISFFTQVRFSQSFLIPYEVHKRSTYDAWRLMTHNDASVCHNHNGYYKNVIFIVAIPSEFICCNSLSIILFIKHKYKSIF